MSKKTNLEEMHELANSVRRVYNRLRHTSDLLHTDTGVSAPKRTLLMDLQRYGAQTVPNLASARFISRQIIQTQINELKQAGYVTAKANPEHKRSSLIELTARGRQFVKAMNARENAFMQEAGWLPSKDSIKSCIEVLDQIDQQLQLKA